ncbi:MAG: hypothetical protein ACQCN4_13135 [Candidatus Bathyarchaeia archaeon]|jgi:hypothetical protein
MKERVAVATVQGKAYFLIVNALKEQEISFASVIPGEPIPPRAKMVITTEKEKPQVVHHKILVLKDEEEVGSLMVQVKKVLLGKENCGGIIVGIDPGESIGVAVVADGKVLEEATCRSIREVISIILKVIKTVNFSTTNVSIKVGNGVPVHRDLLGELDEAMPAQVELEAVGEAGTNRPLKMHSRKIRHISSAIRIAGRTGHLYTRRMSIAAYTTTQ